jgi:hypothetical protein
MNYTTTITTKIILAFALLSLSMLTACGGGGGGGGGAGAGNGGGAANAPVFSLTDATVAPAEDSAQLEFALELNGTTPILMQFDIEIGSDNLSLEGSEAIRALQARGVEFAPLEKNGRTIRVIFGDAGRTDALDAGGLVRLNFDVDESREAGIFDIKITNIVVADADGNAVARDDLNAAEIVGKITLE